VRQIVALATLAVCLLGVASASACGPRGSKVMLRTHRVVVSSKLFDRRTSNGQFRRHYACARGSSKSYVLDDPNADDDPYGEFFDQAYLFRTNRNYLAYAREAGDVDGNYLIAEIVVLNTSTGRRRISRSVPPGAEFNFVTDLVVTRAGRAAWIVVDGVRGDEAHPPWEVRRLTRRKPDEPARLDRSGALAPRSLVLGAGGRRAFWRRGSKRVSARL
jgi:hypothetical protein